MDSIEQKISELTQIQLNNFSQGVRAIFLFIAFMLFVGIGLFIGLIVVFLFMLIISIIISLIRLIFTGNGEYSGSLNFLTILFIPSVFITVVYGFYLLKKISKKMSILDKIRNECLKIYRLLKSTTHLRENIDEIIESLEFIQSKLTIIKRLLFFRFIFSESGRQKLQRLFLLSAEISLSIIGDLKKDLEYRITEHQSILHSSVTDIRIDESDNAGLSQVMAIQKTRLDHQIKQFEELQKVLVKI